MVTPFATAEDWLCLDIETTGGRPESAEEFMRRQWSPAPNWTPETIGKRFHEALAKKREKLALLDAAGIAVIAFNGPRIGRVILHRLEVQAETRTDYATIIGCESEAAMLCLMRERLAGWCDAKTILCGHNIRAFDLPRLRLACLRAGLQLPEAMNAAQPHFDSMREFCRAFSVERSEMVGLAEVLEKLGIPNHKGIVDGSQIDELIAQREFEAILRYAALDVSAESEVFLRLTGRSGQLR